MTEPSDYLYIVDLNNARDLDVESGIAEPSWDDFRQSLMSHKVRSQKDGPAFLPVMMKPESEWELRMTKKTQIEHYRFDVNIEAITALVIDIDKPGALEVAEQVFEGYEYIVYSTHNFTPETPWKYRMVARLADPVDIADWPACFQALRSRIEIDPACCNPSRCYYYPSHSVNSHITPRAFHRTGKAISLREIMALESETSKLSSLPLKMRTVGTLPLQQVRAKRHFSGHVVGHYDRLPEVMSFTRKAFNERHAQSLADYAKEGSRHNLALSVTSREYYMLGPKVNVRSLLLFLYQAAAEGVRPMESGNTPDELPAMLVSAMEKFAPEAYDKMLSDYGDAAYRWLIDEIDWAQNHYERVGERIQPVETHEPVMVDPYLVMRQRHKDLLKSYVNQGSTDMLFAMVLDRELHVPEPPYQDLAHALVKYCKGYLVNVAKLDGSELSGAMSNQIRSFVDQLRPEGNQLMTLPQEKRTFMRSALLVELSKERKKTADLDSSPSP